jgi:uncharacterized protein (TIGR02145 family)
MKNRIRIIGTILIIILISSCKKDVQVLLPEVITASTSNILYESAVSGGTVASDGGGNVVARGVCWSTAPDPTTADHKTADGTGKGDFTSSIYGLKLGTLYYVRAYAMNTMGTVYGDPVTFTTKVTGVKFNSSMIYGTLTDIDGKNYKTIPIGSQVWMAENLKTTKFNDGTQIPLIVDAAQWTNIITPAFCGYANNDTLYENIYGAYYNWFAVSSGKLCPSGWHVPSDTEFQLMIDFLGGDNSAGSKLKESGSNNWSLPNRDATNASGITALPAGMRSSLDGSFSGQGIYGGWWTSTETNSSPMGAAWSRWIHADTTVVARSEIFKKDGFSVRCLKD